MKRYLTIFRGLFAAIILLSLVAVPFVLAHNVQQRHITLLAQSSPWLGAYDQRVKLTIASTNIDSALTGFPILVYLSASSGTGTADVSFIFDELTLDANRKKIAVTTSDKTTEVFVEIERWDDGNEVAWLWVNAGVVASDASTVLYLYFDKDVANNTDFVGDPGDAVVYNVWDGNFVSVYHYNEVPGVVNPIDSTGNNGGHQSNMDASNHVDDLVGKAYDFDGSAEYVFSDNESNFDFATESFTLECLLNVDTVVAGNRTILSKLEEPTPNPKGYFLRQDGTGAVHMWVHDGAYKNAGTPDSTILAGTDYYAAGTYDADADEIGLMLNDTFFGPTSSVGSPTQNNRVFTVARNAFSVAEWQYFPGVIDEVRVSDIERSNAWLKATYHTCFDNLISFGSEEAR